jgi:hypothetical protein
MDIDGFRKANLGRDSKRFLAIFSPKWTLLDVLERLWMVGRVATKFNAQVTEFYYFSKIRNSKCPHEDPLKRVAVKGRRRTSAESCHWRA